MGKKDEYRFTIRFDPDDDRHRRAAQILNSQGRKIARYVARAVLAYNGEVTMPGENELLQRDQKEVFSYHNHQEEAGYEVMTRMEEGYEMDQEEIALLKNSSNIFRRK
ncbi:MAG: hypothetical protein LBT06_20845 [Hungatella sp.]|jgi:hypothetical protein|nr:hypothetical protein [Hungatella sp.]